MKEKEEQLNKELIELAQTPSQLTHLLKLIEHKETSPGFVMEIVDNLLDRLERKTNANT